MRMKFTAIRLFTIAALLINISFAQITLVNKDYDFQYKTGNKITTSVITTASTIDIGSEGSTSWDFSELQADLTYENVVVSPGLTDYRPDFPSAQTGFEYTFEQNENTEHDWEFYCRSDFYVHLHGLVNISETNPNQVKKVIYDPIKIFAELPFTFESAWKDTVTEIVKVMENGVQVSRDEITVITAGLVDAYGPVTFPNGVTSDAIRVRVHETRTGVVTGERLYFQWVTKSGELLTVEADPSSASSGTISASSVKWLIYNPSTAVTVEKPGLPEKFKLNPNFPNPFNPGTSLTYAVPHESEVTISVFNTIGKEVALLVSERKQPGVYSVSFDSKGLTSGIYFAKMTAGNYSQVIKMTMLK